jgi:enoyl-[acyl-carrier protein] reductase I
VTKEDIGRASLFFLSDLSAGITGETTHVDCGFNIMGI